MEDAKPGLTYDIIAVCHLASLIYECFRDGVCSYFNGYIFAFSFLRQNTGFTIRSKSKDIELQKICDPEGCTFSERVNPFK